ncbi:hypothetical protein M2132_000517 [Dysgonomonas sp. PH5-45]|uniref:hypothetical protein n=1 Tax=unclassified Dysgonomonas TaxID=2630389 RepID=UPI0024751697|nr:MULTISPECIES: hypothetical protein [unclassified Dysgonomonas]MDH6354190.1 hypothetical protein [Dysgonomonas sp. PH5-45]MDH6387091.1 hypothetical protein [Dysgonomonas sp. PH5-37]
MKYIKFEFRFNKDNFKENFFQKLLIRIVFLLFPKANPDYEDKINNAVYWLLELDENDGFPTREIGLNKDYKSILKMPYKKNYGYWIDSNMTYMDFIERFHAESIESEFFNKKWNELV